jgi:hypothetical protein
MFVNLFPSVALDSLIVNLLGNAAGKRPTGFNFS